MKRKRVIFQLLTLSLFLMGMMVFIRLQPIYQLVPIVILLLAALILLVIEKSKKDKAAYKKIKK